MLLGHKIDEKQGDVLVHSDDLESSRLIPPVGVESETKLVFESESIVCAKEFESA